jgi:hypothetical protein
VNHFFNAAKHQAINSPIPSPSPFSFIGHNESVGKVSFLKNVPSAESKLRNYFLPSKVIPTPGATPMPLTKMETISILYYDCLTLSTFSFIKGMNWCTGYLFMS